MTKDHNTEQAVSDLLQPSVFLPNVHHAYAQIDGTYSFPNSREGDMLKTAKREIEELRAALSQVRGKAQEPEGYTDAWIAEQFKRTLMLTVSRDDGKEEEPLTEAEIMKALRVFGNRVLMQFGDREGMYRAFSEAYERDKEKRESAVPQVAQQSSEKDAERFVFEHSNPKSMAVIELSAMQGGVKSLDWWREQIDAAIAKEKGR